MAAFEDCGTLTAASASTGAINLLGGKMRRVRAVCLPASRRVRGWDLEFESGLLQRRVVNEPHIAIKTYLSTGIRLAFSPGVRDASKLAMGGEEFIERNLRVPVRRDR